MAIPMTAAKVVAALCAEGVHVQEHRSWRTHNRNHKGAWGPVHGVYIHHTAGVGSGLADYCYNGSADLPGPVCHAFAAKDGAVYLVGHGRANHAGGIARNAYNAAVNESATHPHPDAAEPVDGNAHFYGLEIENKGDGLDPYPDDQYDQSVRWAAAHCRAHGWSADSVIGHKEATRRKVDPSFSMDQFRADVAERLAHPASWSPGDTTKPIPTVPQEDPMPPARVITESVPADDRLPAGQYTLIKMAQDTAALQGPCTYVATAYATVTGTPGTRVTARWHDLPLATGRPSLDLPMDAGVIGPDGTLNLAVTRTGGLDAKEQLRIELRADATATVTRRVLRALRTDA
ncbi:peptidoglycan recognition family protein [Streptomyces sp. BE147]|uniref:N-acetylmuramoyl-L-alanine amidase n=1 Tax=Streptomyces sp. BE147 TaxID=3002524 RepID=UPI002E7999C0|nr:peptidoglycan recognition family protein [Streptomyces sp. BE147]MEE1738834.1 peptidoglycan recognition family protein [Streptomyces sp. BE147]